jgi:hypothetical protein
LNRKPSATRNAHFLTVGTPTRPGSPNDPSRRRTPNSPFSYDAATILTQEQVANWLGVSTRTVRKLPIRRWASSRRLVRYLARHVLEYLEEEAT